MALLSHGIAAVNWHRLMDADLYRLLQGSVLGRSTEFAFGMYAAMVAVAFAGKPLPRWVPVGCTVALAWWALGLPLLHHALYTHRHSTWLDLLSAPAWAVLIVACAAWDWRLPRLLAWRPLAALGLISYSVYLYNPLTIYLPLNLVPWLPRGSASSLALTGMAVLAVGCLGYWLVERPFMGWRARLRGETQPQPAILPRGIITGNDLANHCEGTTARR